VELDRPPAEDYPRCWVFFIKARFLIRDGWKNAEAQVRTCASENALVLSLVVAAVSGAMTAPGTWDAAVLRRVVDHRKLLAD
jgi:hypothetical protein